jgi:hypothetical protein
VQVEFSEQELLMSAPIAEPLFAGGVRCHGGFDVDGNYVSPRTLFRVPAIEAWQDQHRREFGADVLHVPLSTWPPHFPNVEQARYLISSGVVEPLIATLTRIGTVEGFGANIRLLDPGDLQRHFEESIAGTAAAHLGHGLFEAHARDEAGWDEEAGHREMWFAARDIAFEGRSVNVDIEAMLVRMGFEPAEPGAGGSAPKRTAPIGERLLPADIDPGLEAMVRLMARVLFIEVSAFHTFAWAEEWLADPDLVAGDGAASRLVTYIRADEAPHVSYLSTALSEMRDRTWIGSSGRRNSGNDMIGAVWEHSLRQSLGPVRAQTRKATMGEIEYWCKKRPGGEAIVEGFLALGDAEPATECWDVGSGDAATGY